jgi:DHA2 family multidrug resistance protein
MSPTAIGKPQHVALLTLCVMLATIMQALDTTIANVALPYMQGTLSATADQINWVLTSYIVAAAIATPVTGFLEARLGRKQLFLGAVSGFTAASVLHRHRPAGDGAVPPRAGPVRRLAGAAVASRAPRLLPA